VTCGPCARRIGGEACDCDDVDVERQVLVLQPAAAAVPRRGPPHSSPFPLPHQGRQGALTPCMARDCEVPENAPSRPRQALAQDQLGSLRRLASGCSPALSIECFDGDTPKPSRARIRDESNLLLTNPDIIHVTILPQHKQWATVLRDIRLLVIDEAHMYRGELLLVAGRGRGSSHISDAQHQGLSAAMWL
jgi:hypothetical protein